MSEKKITYLDIYKNQRRKSQEKLKSIAQSLATYLGSQKNLNKDGNYGIYFQIFHKNNAIFHVLSQVGFYSDESLGIIKAQFQKNNYRNIILANDYILPESPKEFKFIEYISKKLNINIIKPFLNIENNVIANLSGIYSIKAIQAIIFNELKTYSKIYEKTINKLIFGFNINKIEIKKIIMDLQYKLRHNENEVIDEMDKIILKMQQTANDYNLENLNRHTLKGNNFVLCFDYQAGIFDPKFIPTNIVNYDQVTQIKKDIFSYQNGERHLSHSDEFENFVDPKIKTFFEIVTPVILKLQLNPDDNINLKKIEKICLEYFNYFFNEFQFDLAIQIAGFMIDYKIKDGNKLFQKANEELYAIQMNR